MARALTTTTAMMYDMSRGNTHTHTHMHCHSATLSLSSSTPAHTHTRVPASHPEQTKLLVDTTTWGAYTNKGAHRYTRPEKHTHKDRSKQIHTHQHANVHTCTQTCTREGGCHVERQGHQDRPLLHSNTMHQWRTTWAECWTVLCKHVCTRVCVWWGHGIKMHECRFCQCLWVGGVSGGQGCACENTHTHTHKRTHAQHRWSPV